MIIIEGMDGVGKSTLAENLKPFGFNRYHFDYDENNLDLFTKYRNVFLTSDNKTALDRSFISEIVYGPIIRGNCRLNNVEFIKLLKIYENHNSKLFYLHATKDCLIQRRGNNIKDSSMLCIYYDELYLQYDYQDIDYTLFTWHEVAGYYIVLHHSYVIFRCDFDCDEEVFTQWC